jgi:hypothetical protein
MGTVFWAIVSWWLFIAVISSFYFWAKKTDRSQAPLERRIRLSAMALLGRTLRTRA